MRKIDAFEEQARQLEKDHEAESKTLRAELGEAQDTIASQDKVNENLAAELIETSSARDALQQSLENSERDRDETIRTLTAKLKNADSRLSEAEEQLENKNKSIAALLSELANKSQSIESIDEIEEAIQDLNGRISNRIDDRALEEPGRPERALTGTFEGKELRFPLQKDRLTIGRTSRNDIQLQAQFVSRHHAIVLIENGQTRIIDWGSKNGVFVNDKRVEESDLNHGDHVAIGNAEFLYEEVPPSKADD